jgi:hypothetical protein
MLECNFDIKILNEPHNKWLHILNSPPNNIGNWIKDDFVRFEIFTAVVMRSIIFWDMTPCSLLSCNRSFGGTYRLHLQGRRNNFSKNQQAGGKQNAPSTCLLAGCCWNYFFDPEDGGDMFLRNFGCNSTDYTASYPRIWYSPKMICLPDMLKARGKQEMWIIYWLRIFMSRVFKLYDTVTHNIIHKGKQFPMIYGDSRHLNKSITRLDLHQVTKCSCAVMKKIPEMFRLPQIHLPKESILHLTDLSTGQNWVDTTVFWIVLQFLGIPFGIPKLSEGLDAPFETIYPTETFPLDRRIA